MPPDYISVYILYHNSFILYIIKKYVILYQINSKGDRMKHFSSIPVGEAVTTVNKTNCAAAVKSGSLEVFATPMMLALMEEATCNAAALLLESDETTVGTKVTVTHDKASGIGTVITATASLTEVDGRRLVFEVSATDDKGDTVGRGTIERFLACSEKFMNRVNGK